MKLEYVSETGSGHLILLFAGWGMDARPFMHLRKEGYDIAVVYDYTFPDFNIEVLEKYGEIVVIAWSMGVYYAQKTLGRFQQLPVTARVAVNGTLTPIDSERGIPEELFRKSAPKDAISAMKFYRRVCGGASGLLRFMPELPERTPEDLSRELLAIADEATRAEMPSTEAWTRVIISESDRIFPPEAMKKAWADANSRVTFVADGNHIIDFQKLINTYIADKHLIGTRFSGSVHTYNSQARVQRDVAGRLVDMMKAQCREPLLRGSRVIEIGAGAGMLTSMFLPLLDDCDVELWDIAEIVAPENSGGCRVTARRCDAEAEAAALPNDSVDLFVSSSTIQWFNSPVTFLRRIADKLRPGGMAFFSFFTKGTFEGFGSHGLQYIDLRPDDIAISGTTSEISEARYDLNFQSASAALHHIRYTGVNSVSRERVSLGDIRRIMNNITNADGTATLTFNATFLTMKKTFDKETVFVTGIDTDAGKSYATAWLVNHLSKTGRKVLTQKFVQTGNTGRSEDIEIHRSIAGANLESQPLELVAPQIFSYPASADLAARLEGRKVDFSVIDDARQQLEQRCDTLLVEGAGGIMVPLDGNILTIDYIVSRRLPVAVVTNGKLGSINHTLLTLESLKTRGIKLRYLLYNTHFDTDKTIADDAREYIRNCVRRDFPQAEFLEVPSLKID